jgi:predicted amino acid dehydrogenase
VKEIVNISLGASQDDYTFKTRFKGRSCQLRRIGTDGDFDRAWELLLKWNKRADVIGLGGTELPPGPKGGSRRARQIEKLIDLGRQLFTPVTTGKTLRNVAFEWALRHVHFKFGNNYFTNARVFYFSGLTQLRSARVMSEFTDNLIFADPYYETGVPRFVSSLKELDLYAGGISEALRWMPGRRLLTGTGPVRRSGAFLRNRAVGQSHVLVVPHNGFFRYLDDLADDALEDKIVITLTAYEDRIAFLKEKGAAVVIDPIPLLYERVVGASMMEALLISTLTESAAADRDDDLLEIICDMEMEPRIVYPSGSPKRVNRFAYIVYPLDQSDLKRLKPIEMLADVVPGAMDPVEKAMAYAPPFVYSKVTGIQSPTGAEAEGWLIALGETPEQMQAHGAGFTTKRLLQAARSARRRGAQVMGIGIFPKGLRDTSLDVAKHAVLPITTGNSYTASAALWAAAEAVRRLGRAKLKNRKILKAKAMVIGATGSVGAICSRLLAKGFEEVTMVSRNMAKLLSLQESITAETPGVTLTVSTRADTHLRHMDVVVAASSGADEVLDIMRLKPGCVVTDINSPSVFTKEEVAKRPDVLVIRGGAIRLPGDSVEMKDIGLPPGVVYPGMAETVILALEGRFEEFTVGSEPEWDKVREIYRLGTLHGMQLAAISGADGVFNDDDIARVKALAAKKSGRRARPKAKG